MGPPGNSHPPSTSSSFDDTDSTPLPGVCYIRYPPTPDLAAVLHPSSSSASHEDGLNASRTAAVSNHKSARLARCRRADPSPEPEQKVEEEKVREGQGDREVGRCEPGCGAGEDGSRSTGFPRDEAAGRRADPPVAASSRRADGAPGNEDNDAPREGSWKVPFDNRPGSEGDGGNGGGNAAPAETGRVTPGAAEYNGKSSNQEEDQHDEEQKGEKQERRQPRRQSQAAENDSVGDRTTLDSRSRVAGSESRPEAVAAEESRRRHRPGGGRRMERWRRREAGGRAKSNKILSMMTKDGHPLVASRAFPTLPGVDEHQRPPFLLAQMHDNMRKDR